MNKWTLGKEIRVLIASGLDVPNFLMDVPNLLKDVTKVPKSIQRWGTTFNHFPRVLEDQMDHEKDYKGPNSPSIGYTKFS